MRFPQLVVFEADGRVAALLQPVAEENAWSLREPRRVESCLKLLARGSGGPSVVVIRAGRDLEKELLLLDSVHQRFPEVAVVLITESDHARLIGLAWDLGATYVVVGSSVAKLRERLFELVPALMGGPA